MSKHAIAQVKSTMRQKTHSTALHHDLIVRLLL